MKKLFTSLQSNAISGAVDFWTVLILFLAGVLIGTYHSGHLTGLFASVTEAGKFTDGGLAVFLFQNLKFQLFAFLFAFFLFGFLLIPCLSFLFAYVYAYAFCTCRLSSASVSACAVYMLLFLLSVPPTVFLFADCQRISIRYFQTAICKNKDARLYGREFIRPAVLFALLAFVNTVLYLILKVWR